MFYDDIALIHQLTTTMMSWWQRRRSWMMRGGWKKNGDSQVLQRSMVMILVIGWYGVG
jgi:hypothetical protein